mgnify:CR=1 FL=1
MSHLTTFPEARKPSASELRMRSNVLFQLWRFVILNVKMVIMVTLGHH